MNVLVDRILRAEVPPPAYRAAFDLARVLKGHSADQYADNFELVADWFFDRICVPKDIGWIEFERAWVAVHTPEGAGRWELAVQWVLDRPELRGRIVPSPGPAGKPAATIALLAAHLFLNVNESQPFVFSGEKIAESLNIPVRTAYDALASLVDRGIIAWHDPSFSSKSGKARVAVFTGDIQ